MHSNINDKLKQKFEQFTLIYQFRGIFSFLTDNEHISNIKIYRKVIIVLDFRYVITHDVEFLGEYLAILNRIIRDSRLEIFVTGIPFSLVQNDLLLQESWVGQLNKHNRLIFIN